MRTYDAEVVVCVVFARRRRGGLLGWGLGVAGPPGSSRHCTARHGRFVGKVVWISWFHSVLGWRVEHFGVRES